MTDQLPTPDWLTEDPGVWDGCDAEEAWERVLDGECAPRLATPAHVTNLQHWLDLCA